MKKLFVGLLAFGSLSSFAADVCTIKQSVNFSEDSFMNCSIVDNGKTKKVNKNSTLLLKRKIEQGYKIESTVISQDNVIYTLIKL